MTPPGSPVCRRQSQKRNPSSRCPCSSTHPETKTPWKGHRTEMSGFRNGSIKRFRKVRLDDVGVFVFYVFDSYCTASCLSETSPWNSIRGAHGTLSCLQVPSSPCASAWLSRRCCTCLMAEMSEPRWTKPWPLVGLPVWKLMAGTHLNRFGATLTLLRIWVVEGLPVFEVPCQNMFKRRLEGSSSTRTIEKKHKKISTKHGFQDMDLPRNIRLNPMNSFHVQHGFSPSKSDVKEIFLTPWDVGHRHLKRTALGTPGLSEIPRLHDYHPEAKPEDFRRDFWNDPPFRSYQLYGDYIIMVIYGI